jgi:hypothetical protein
MTFKSIVLAVILVLGSLGIAAAQSSEPNKPLGKVEPGEGGTIAAVVIGWNFFHVFACTTRSSGNVFTWISQEDGNNWTTSDLATIAMLTPSCQTGNFVGFHVISTSLMLFDQILVFPFK